MSRRAQTSISVLKYAETQEFCFQIRPITLLFINVLSTKLGLTPEPVVMGMDTIMATILGLTSKLLLIAKWQTNDDIGLGKMATWVL